MIEYTEPVINFGCKRVKGLPDHKQKKNIKKPWYIYYRAKNPDTGKWETFDPKGGINYYHTIEERLQAASVERDALSLDLKDGYNPFAKKFTQSITAESLPGTEMLFCQALEWGLKKKLHPEPGTKPPSALKSKDIRSAIKQVTEQAVRMGFDALLIKDVSRKHILAVLQSRQSDPKRPFGAVRYNDIRSHLHNIYEVLLLWEVVQVNVVKGVPRQKESKPTRFRPATPSEQKEIITYLDHVDADFLTYYLCVFLSGLRPITVFKLKPIHLKREPGKEHGVWHIEEYDHKTGEKVGDIWAPVPAELMARVLRLIDGADPNQYIFGWNFRPTTRPEPVKRRRASERWKELIKDGLGINRDLYAGKHGGGEAKREQGIELEDVQAGFGHTDKATTIIYLPNEQRRRALRLAENTKPFLPEQEGK